MGFGHRVYKNFDPRAKVMKQSADEVLGLLGIENNPTLQVAKELERIALEDEYFIDKKLYPERRLLLGHHPRRDRLPDLDVHRRSSRSPAPSAGSRSGRRCSRTRS